MVQGRDSIHSNTVKHFRVIFMSEINDTVKAYYDQENLRRSEWLNVTMRDLVPKEIVELMDKNEVGAAVKAQEWLKDNGYKMEISPDNVLIQLWKGNEQVAQYQTIVPAVIETLSKKE